MNLKVKFLGAGAVAPVCAHPGEDLGYDIFASSGVIIKPGERTLVRTNIAVDLCGFGFLIRDRSSKANEQLFVTGGVIDAGYRGEILVGITNQGGTPAYIGSGDKVAQLVPIHPETSWPVVVCNDLSESARGEDRFGSTGK